jgi:hypothetical protein
MRRFPTSITTAAWTSLPQASPAGGSGSVASYRREDAKVAAMMSLILFPVRSYRMTARGKLGLVEAEFQT